MNLMTTFGAIRGAVIAGVAVTGLFAGTASLAQEKITLKFASVHADPEALYNKNARFFGEELERQAPGVFDFQLYPASQLGNEREILEGMRLGTIEMTASGVLGIVDPTFDVFDMPFLFSDRDHVYSVQDGEVGRNMLENLKDDRLVALGYMENGWRHITNNKHPIKVPEDLEGLKQRVVEHQVYLATMKALGASPVPIPYGELYTALRSGVVDGQDNPLSNIYSARLHEVQDYLTLSGHVYSNGVVIASARWWDELTPEQQDVIRATVQATVEYGRKQSIQADQELVEELSKHMEINEISDKTPFIEATQSVYGDFSDKFSPELIESIRQTEVQDYSYTN